MGQSSPQDHHIEYNVYTELRKAHNIAGTEHYYFSTDIKRYFKVC